MRSVYLKAGGRQYGGYDWQKIIRPATAQDKADASYKQQVMAARKLLRDSAYKEDSTGQFYAVPGKVILAAAAIIQEYLDAQGS